jgi:excisionase family DNA binding protein
MYQNLKTIDEMANRLNVKKSWLYGKTRLKGEGQIPYLRVGKYLRFFEDEVMAWLKNQQKAE